MLLRACSSGGLKLLCPESLVLAWGASGLGAFGQEGLALTCRLTPRARRPLAAPFSRSTTEQAAFSKDDGLAAASWGGGSPGAASRAASQHCIPLSAPVLGAFGQEPISTGINGWRNAGPHLRGVAKGLTERR